MGTGPQERSQHWLWGAFARLEHPSPELGCGTWVTEGAWVYFHGLQPALGADSVHVNEEFYPFVRGGQEVIPGKNESAVCACWEQADRDSVALMICMARCWPGWMP